MDLFDSVVFLYDNEDLMKRDKEDFEDWWILIDKEKNVKY